MGAGLDGEDIKAQSGSAIQCRKPMERILGREIGTMMRTLHEEHGVKFHLPGKVRSLSDLQVVLKSNETLEADLVVLGIGVRPSLGLAEQAGIAVDRGIIVDSICGLVLQGSSRAADHPTTVTSMANPEISRFPRKERPYMPGSQTTPGQASTHNSALAGFAFREVNNMGTRFSNAFAARWLAYHRRCGQDGRVRC
jgi:hypothetical protein